MKEDTYNSFGIVIAREGDTVRLTAMNGTGTIQAVAATKIHTSDIFFRVRFSPESVSTLALNDWHIEVVPPKVEDGFYSSKWTSRIYQVAGDVITFTRLSAGSVATVSRYDQAAFAKGIEKGAFVRLVAGS